MRQSHNTIQSERQFNPSGIVSAQKSGRIESQQDGADSYYENDEFDELSMSKSQMGAGLGLAKSAQKPGTKQYVQKQISGVSKSSNNDDGNYSDDGFESVSVSHSVSKSTKLTTKKIPGATSKQTNYSPIKEADEEAKYEESKSSATAKKDISQSYGTTSNSNSKNNRFSSNKKGSAMESSGNIEDSSYSMSHDVSNSKNMAQRLQQFMKNDYAGSMSGDPSRSRGRGKDNDSSDDDTSYNTTSMSSSANIVAQRLQNFEYLKQKYKIDSNLEGVEDTDDEDSSDQTG